MDTPLESEGVAAGAVHLIVQGRVKVVTQTAHGRPVVLAVRGWISTERRRVVLLDVEALRQRGS